MVNIRRAHPAGGRRCRTVLPAQRVSDPGGLHRGVRNTKAHRGLEKAGQPGVDLVVLDVMLPGLDGFEILRRLRQQSKVPVHHAHRARRGCGPHRRAGTGRRRLPAQALQPARAGGPHPRHPAALRSRSPPRPARRAWKSTAWRIDPGSREVLRRRPTGGPHHLRIRHPGNADALRRPRALPRRPDGEFLQPQGHPLRPLHRHAHQPPAQEAGTRRHHSSRPFAAWATSSAARRRTRAPNELAVRQDSAVVLVHAGHHGGRLGLHFRAQHEPQLLQPAKPRGAPGDFPAGGGAGGLRNRRPAGARRRSWTTLRQDLRRATASSPTRTAATC